MLPALPRPAPRSALSPPAAPMADQSNRLPPLPLPVPPSRSRGQPQAAPPPPHQDKPKYNNVQHRTTTESIRLAGQEGGSQPQPPPQSGPAPAPARKISSFQITSVTVGARAGVDAGDDSADDLDESHTDDISRVTDLENETPSFSEDTFSKDDVFYNASSTSLGCAPVIPTSSQYGLAIVGQEHQDKGSQQREHGDQRGSEPGQSQGQGHAGEQKPAEAAKEHEHARNERFKVVKIESTEPFRRGRWTCMDYLDHPSAAPPSAPKEDQPQERTLNECSVERHDEVGESLKQPAKELQVSGVLQPEGHQFPAASPGQSLGQQQLQQQQQQQQHGSTPAPTQLQVQSPPIELPQQMTQPSQHPQSMSHVSLNPQPTHAAPSPNPVQQLPQSFPSHQLQQVIAQAQGMPPMQPMQIHQQIPPQQMQQAQIQQIQGQHMPSMPGMQQMQQLPQMQQMPTQGQMQQMQMQQMTNQQVANQQALHQIHGQTSQMHVQNQQAPMSHLPNQPTMHPMQSQTPHSMPSHLQQMQQMPQMNSQQSTMQQMHGQPGMHQLPQQSNQVTAQTTQMQSQQHYTQLQQQGMSGMQHSYNTQSVSQSTNPQTMIQQTMNSQSQHLTQQPQVSQPMVPSQHSVPQYYQQPPLTQQGQSLSQEVMANIVNSQQGNSIANNMQSINTQQGATLPANINLTSQQNTGMHTMPQSTPNMQNTMQMMTQGASNISMPIDNNPQTMQIPVSDPIYMQAGNVNQQMSINQHMPSQQNMINQQVNQNSVPQNHISQQNQIPISHVMQTQQNISNPSSVPAQVNQNTMTSMQNVQVQQNQQMSSQIPQVSMSNVQQQQQQTQPMMQNMVSTNPPPMNQNVHNQNMTMSMQQNIPSGMQGPTVHTVPTSVVNSQTSIHPQSNMGIGSYNQSQAGVGSIPQSVMPAMSQPTMTAPVGMQNTNNQMDVHITQQNICSSTPSVSQNIISGTNSPIVSLPVSSNLNYAQNPASAQSGVVDTQNFGSPVSAVVSHVVNSLVNSSIGLSIDLVNNDSSGGGGGGTPASDTAQQTDISDGKDETTQSIQNGEETESWSGLAMALVGGGSSNEIPSRAATPVPQPLSHQPHHHHTEHSVPNSASGTSAVAIDNKIEQAMDLVKSHLMFAVREEVEVLKERISELMERINQLEAENSILRAQASQETLAQLSIPPPATSPPSGPIS